MMKTFEHDNEETKTIYAAFAVPLTTTTALTKL